MKGNKLLSVTLCLVLIFVLAVPAFAAQTITVDPINVMVGGNVFLPTDVNGNNVPVFAYNGTTYAPLRALAEAYGLTVSYNGERQLAAVDGTPSADFVGTKGTAQALTKRTILPVSPINIEVNGAVFQPKDVNGNDVPVFAYNGTSYAPLRALAEAYGLSVGYNAEKNLAAVDFVSTGSIDFADLLKEINAERKAEVEASTLFEGYKDYLVNDPATRDLLTKAEIDALLNTEDRPVHSVSVEEAVRDIDLLFRALRVGYGSYYFFGQEAFDRAEAEVMAWLDGQSTVLVFDLALVLRRSLSFMVDSHSFVAFDVEESGGIRYKYHYCTEQQYDKDELGWFKLVNGKRVDFVGFSDNRVTMEPTLLSDGKLVWSPVLHCPPEQAAPVSVELKTAGGVTCTETIRWTQSKENQGSGNNPNYRFVMENGLAYINIDRFDQSRYELYSELPATGKQVKNCKAVIFDLRGNGGGPGDPTEDWVKNFTGEYAQAREAGAIRRSALNSSQTQSKFELQDFAAGKRLSNDIPVIVLVDDQCGSNGEVALMRLRTMDNVLVVGTNSSGCQLGGNAVDINLPHTNIDASIGSLFHFYNEFKNIDCIGYKPDVWCESGVALDSAIALLVRSGLVDAASAASFEQAVDAVLADIKTSDDAPFEDSSILISLDFGNLFVQGRSNFGASGGVHTATVYLNDAPVTDFTVTSDDTSICTVKKTADGKLELVMTGPGTAAITVRCSDAEQIFYVTSRL